MNKKEYNKQYYQNHKKSFKEYHRTHYQENKDRILKQCKQYRIENPEKAKETWRKYRQTHKEERKTYDKQWRIDNKEKDKEYRQTKKYKVSQKRFRQSPKRKEYISKWEPSYRKIYRQTRKGKEAEKRSAAHHRKLGFIPLNKSQKGWEGHHINQNEVIYMLKHLHRSIWHSLDKPETMEKINRIAYSFLE